MALRRGWKVFPLVHSSPFATRQPLLDSATSSMDQIEQWEEQYADRAWAVATGSGSGVFAVEASRVTGISTLQLYSEDDWALSSTLQISAPGRVILFFLWPDGGLPAFQRLPWGCGMYLRQVGDYVRLPSVYSPGIAGSFVLEEAPIQKAPQGLRAILNILHPSGELGKELCFPSVSKSYDTLLVFSRSGDRWLCDFYSVTGRKLGRTFVVCREPNLIELIKRGGATMNDNLQQSLQACIRQGRGKILLHLTGDQYAKLLAA